MKLALIADTHFGVRNDNSVFLDSMERFLSKTFFPKIKELGIKRIVHLGDLVDRRKYINIATLQRMRRCFVEPIMGMGISCDVIAGNHDEYYKNTHEVNALDELLPDHERNFYVYTEATTVFEEHNLSDICYIPWITDSNRKHAEDVIRNTKAQVAFGHLELEGFELYRGQPALHGTLDQELLKKFELVATGHFHHRSNRGNIHYIGAAGEYVWSDYEDPRGFSIYDTVTRTLEFVRNPEIIFWRYAYDDTQDFDLKKAKRFVEKNAAGRVVRVVVKAKTNAFYFDSIVDAIQKANPADLTVIDSAIDVDTVRLDAEMERAEDTRSLITNYVAALDVGSISKTDLEERLLEIYDEAVSLGY